MVYDDTIAGRYFAVITGCYCSVLNCVVIVTGVKNLFGEKMAKILKKMDIEPYSKLNIPANFNFGMDDIFRNLDYVDVLSDDDENRIFFLTTTSLITICAI